MTTAEAGAAHDNIGFCEPIAGIRNLKGTARHSDFTLWAKRCQISGQKGNCGDAGTHWPQGDSGRCETTTAFAGIEEPLFHSKDLDDRYIYDLIGYGKVSSWFLDGLTDNLKFFL